MSDKDETAQAEILFSENERLTAENKAISESLGKAAGVFLDAKLEAHNIMKRLLSGNDMNSDRASHEVMRVAILGQLNDYIRFLDSKMLNAGLVVR
jgi:hypothetical protein